MIPVHGAVRIIICNEGSPFSVCSELRATGSTAVGMYVSCVNCKIENGEFLRGEYGPVSPRSPRSALVMLYSSFEERDQPNLAARYGSEDGRS